MVPQTFALTDLPSVLTLILLEGLLSADNALVLALMVRHLSKSEQQKALLYGLGGAFVFRLIAILLASFMLGQWWIQAIGGLYLLYLPIKHFLEKHRESQGVHKLAKKAGFWPTVIAVELTDMAFAIDSVLAGVGFITKKGVGIQMDKIWVVYLGAILGIVLLRFAASLFIRLLERFPDLDNLAYALVAWVGVKLALHAAEKAHELYPAYVPFQIPWSEGVFWGGMAVISIVGGAIAYARRRTDAEIAEHEAETAEARDSLDDASDLVISPEEQTNSDSENGNSQSGRIEPGGKTDAQSDGSNPRRVS
ncbi:MAG: TerC family protein [Fimbriimonadaceae bacterium]|nr:TerC family protein [Fimbriimonadaceae bacterium]